MLLYAKEYKEVKRYKHGWSQGLKLRDRSINNIYIYIYIYETPNKHSFGINKPSIKTNIQNYYFLIITMQLFMKMELAFFLNLQNHL